MILVSAGFVLAAIVLLIAGLVLAEPFLVMWSIVVSVLSAVFLLIAVLLRRHELFPSGGRDRTEALTPPSAPLPPPPMGPPMMVPQTAQQRATSPIPPRAHAMAAGRMPAAPRPGSGVSPDAIVLVIPGRKRYHVPGCRQLAGRDHEELTYEEAREEGFTPCTSCLPDAALGGVQTPPTSDSDSERSFAEPTTAPVRAAREAAAGRPDPVRLESTISPAQAPSRPTGPVPAGPPAVDPRAPAVPTPGRPSPGTSWPLPVPGISAASPESAPTGPERAPTGSERAARGPERSPGAAQRPAGPERPASGPESAERVAGGSEPAPAGSSGPAKPGTDGSGSTDGTPASGSVPSRGQESGQKSGQKARDTAASQDAPPPGRPAVEQTAPSSAGPKSSGTTGSGSEALSWFSRQESDSRDEGPVAKSATPGSSDPSEPAAPGSPAASEPVVTASGRPGPQVSGGSADAIPSSPARKPDAAADQAVPGSSAGTPARKKDEPGRAATEAAGQASNPPKGSSPERDDAPDDPDPLDAVVVVDDGGTPEKAAPAPGRGSGPATGTNGTPPRETPGRTQSSAEARSGDDDEAERPTPAPDRQQREAADPDPKDAARGTVKIITGTRRFHSATCPLIRGIDDSGLETLSRSAAEAGGLSSCSVCRHDHQIVG
ncbi:hypothetical protein [Streptosporangium sp. KLBMP 9127]|nr:hypothetical protein [Streptosporangium sp. KLBMP 9127]